MEKKNLVRLIGIACFSVFLMLASYTTNAQTMSVNPFKINLNAQGSAENLQCAYGGYLPAGVIGGENIQIYFAGNLVTDAYNVDYCAVDDMIFVQFDWTTIITSPVLLPLANTGQVVVTIVGSFTVTKADGSVVVFNVDRWGYAEVIKPGKRK